MKHILVPTDFSECADHALDVAVGFAEKFDATLHLFSGLIREEMNTDAKSVEALFEKIKKAHPNVEISYSYSSEKLLEGIQQCIREKEIDFVIMGSHGRGGVSEIFIGSNTQKVVRLIHCPVLIVKGPIKDLSFQRIVFASNFNDSEQQPFLRFKKIIAAFNPEIYLLGVKTSFFFDAPLSATTAAMEKFKELAAPFPCQTYIFKNSNIESGIREFADNIDADLIAISNRNRHPLKRMFAGSNVEALINHSNLPVLSIDYEN